MGRVYRLWLVASLVVGVWSLKLNWLGCDVAPNQAQDAISSSKSTISLICARNQRSILVN